MREEFNQVKALLQSAARSARASHDSIADVREKVMPQYVDRETKVFADQLKNNMSQYREQVMEQIDFVEKSIKNRMLIDPKLYNKDVADLMFMLKPEQEEVARLAEQFAGNETMQRVIRKYCAENDLKHANLPKSGADKLQAVKKIRQDLDYVFACAGEPVSRDNRAGDSYLQTFCEKFETVFAEQLESIGNA